ncbi:hypothetical protein STCU_12085 [Strigomonas culicis]|uniref:MORN repeat-containing protein n=1 Tax=Strigomonas culicis TaxID=28005 RepID=S9UXT7_9TRYP|nr:hypothetical protein STCU_12085 [Strigomonas culicis]|eukprot:EPY15360.1 hypothetical protein STCU_12085 [Strigomonas culicis]
MGFLFFGVLMYVALRAMSKLPPTREVVTLRNADGTVSYEGEVFGGKPHGKGVLYRDDGTIFYRGQFVHYVVQGEGQFLYPDGNVAEEGTFVNGELHGRGVKYSKDGTIIYEGEWVNGVPTGNGPQSDTMVCGSEERGVGTCRRSATARAGLTTRKKKSVNHGQVRTGGGRW